MTIDSHHHFWNYDPVEYGWIDESMKVIRRDFGPADLASEIKAAGIDGVVSVQARQSLEETAWLLETAGAHDFIRGVVGWVPMVSPTVRADLERFVAQPKFKGVRHVVQAEPDDQFILRPDFNNGVRALKEFGLVYDILIFERHLPPTIEFVDRHPEQVFVLDHIAKPKIKDGEVEPWARNIRELAKRPHVSCKVSGLVSEADALSWTEEGLRIYFDTVLEAFGPRRLMFGSDWPVSLVACGYGRWLEIVKKFASHLSESEREQLLGGTAVSVYKL
jgi:L-fuconolactonase